MRFKGGIGMTEQIAAFTVRTRAHAIPQEVKETAKEHLLDGVATMLGGVREEASRKIRRSVIRLGGKAEATILGTRIKAPCQYAALTNGVQGHVLDYDDTQLATSKKSPFGQLTHPTTPVLAAGLALAEKLSSTGKDLLTAYIVGVEVACRLADAIDPSHYLGGFHPTGTIGVFGAAAACCHLMGLDEMRTCSAFGIAASLSAGIRANRGTMTKSLNAGRAAENGIVATALAKEGFSASKNIFEAPMGYLSATSRNHVNRRFLKFGRPFFFAKPGVAIKAYPCAMVLHPSLDLLIGLAKQHNIQAEEVKKVTVKMGSLSAAPLVYNYPATGLEGKFSLPFSTAIAILERKAGLQQYTDPKVRHPKTAALMRKVRLFPDPQLDGFGHEPPQARVEIHLADGRVCHGRTTIPRGHPLNPLSRQDLEGKLRECAWRCLEPKAIERTIAQIWSIERISSVSALVRSMRGKI